MQQFSNIMKNIILLIVTLFISGCATVGDEFCRNSGYHEDSNGYQQCTSRYQAMRDLYEHCNQTRGIISENSGLQQCLADAGNIKNSYNRDKNLCQQKINTKFVEILSSPKQQKQPELTSDGHLIIVNLEINELYNSYEKTSITAPFVNRCVSANGWHNPTKWQRGKQNVSADQFLGTISQIMNENIEIDAPEDITVPLFIAAADNNINTVKRIVRHKETNPNIRNYQGYSALHIASRFGSFQVVQLLLDKLGADFDALSNTGENIIEMASRGRHHALVHYLTEYKIKQRQLENKKEERKRSKNPE